MPSPALFFGDERVQPFAYLVRHPRPTPHPPHRLAKAGVLPCAALHTVDHGLRMSTDEVFERPGGHVAESLVIGCASEKLDGCPPRSIRIVADQIRQFLERQKFVSAR